MADYQLKEQREAWGSRTGFVLAAIGSAVGLGNLWGFPYKVYANGGGAFLIPYLIAMMLVGIPLLILEFSLGHLTQRAAPDAFRGVHRRTEPIGWWGIILSFVIITYYAVILAWCLNYLFFCFQGIFSGGDLPWAGQGIEGVQKAKDFFFQNYLNMWTEEEMAGGIKGWALGTLARPIVISLVVIWVLLYLCIFRGVKAVSKVVLFTVPLPWIMLLILTVRGLTLPGAQSGLKYYLEPNWIELTKPETWRWAFGQMFFSMSLAFGVMITYASFLHRKSDINNNATIIGLADIGTSFVAGIAVFATLGGMAHVAQQAGQAIPVKEIVNAGPGLAFVAFPYALAQLPYSAWFGAVFFIALLTLGIDSAFSITESVLASVIDKTGWNRNRALIGLSVVGFGLGLVYCTRGGLNWLGAVDDFINSAWGGIALLGLLECVVLGWSIRIAHLREHANKHSDWQLGRWWDGIIRYIAPVVLSTLFIWSLLDKVSSSGGFLHDASGDLNLPVMIGLIVAVAAPVIAVLLSIIPSRMPAEPRTDGTEGIAQGAHAGKIGAVLVVIALAGVAIGFVTVRDVKAGAGLPRELVIPWAAAACALAATIIGARVVGQAEKTHNRPHPLGRLAAGLGVVTLGGAAGVTLFVFVATHKPVSEQAVLPIAASENLSPMSYIILAGMTTLLVGGLGWCFYRAIKASSNKITIPQEPAVP